MIKRQAMQAAARRVSGSGGKGKGKGGEREAEEPVSILHKVRLC